MLQVQRDKFFLETIHGLFEGESHTHPGMRVGLTLEEAMNGFKKEFITLNLKHTGGNRANAAKILGIQRTYLSRLISKYSLQNF